MQRESAGTRWEKSEQCVVKRRMGNWRHSYQHIETCEVKKE